MTRRRRLARLARLAPLPIALVVAGGTARAEPSCYEDAVVGSGNCRFGIWGEALEAPYMSVTIGAVMRVLPRPSSSGPRATTTRATTDTESGGIGGGSAPTVEDRSWAYVERVTVAPWRAGYFGVEMELGVSDVSLSDPGARRVIAGGAALAGLRVGSTWLTLTGEIAAGGRVMEISGSPRYDGSGLVELRARADIWLGPWVTIGGMVGRNLLQENEWTAGIALGMHTWSFGGTR
ncbi:MAG: hypothetical protein KF773_26295 [Deltaproteobacteria bacterium]|nr:hypothetical protein [Deltaproteobacteria bacterium]